MAQTTFAQESDMTLLFRQCRMPIPGVSVLVKGTKSGNKLILTGNMQLKLPKSILILATLG
jgi:hypothetical protein